MKNFKWNKCLNFMRKQSSFIKVCCSFGLFRTLLISCFFKVGLFNISNYIFFYSYSITKLNYNIEFAIIFTCV